MAAHLGQGVTAGDITACLIWQSFTPHALPSYKMAEKEASGDEQWYYSTSCAGCKYIWLSLKKITTRRKEK